jgi:RNase H-fold protein (predicted Holliday junction resolvase)
VDPGRDKCGLAVVDPKHGVLVRGIVPTGSLEAVVRQWIREHRPCRLVMGAGTSHREARRCLDGLGIPVEVVCESHTTERARVRYFKEHPPRSWRRLIPMGLQVPPIPVDDYAAVLIAEDYLESLTVDEVGAREDQ